MSARPVAIAPDIARSAVEWLVALQGDDATDATRAAWRQWLAGHPDHLRAWTQIEAVNARLRGVASPLAAAIARTALTPPRTVARRRAMRALAGLFVVGGAAWLARDRAPIQDWLADVHTEVGERRHLTLADGTRVQLNTDTAIDIHLTATERRITLRRGEILVETAPDNMDMPRPFVVVTRAAALRPLGTRFVVRQTEDAGWIGVLEGAVSVQPSATDGFGRIVAAGQQLSFTSTDADPPNPLAEADTAWTDGMLVATGMRLVDFLAEVERYRPGRLRCDPAVAALRVSGTYPLADTDRILDALRTALPVRIHFVTRYWATVLPA